MTTSNDLRSLLDAAANDGVLTAGSMALFGGDLGGIVVAGAAGAALEDIVASDVTLVTVLIDASSSIASRGLEQAVRDGQNLLVDAFSGAREKESILMALWTFNDDVRVHHAYVPVEGATRLDAANYAGVCATRLYDTWCDALAANVAYAQRLRDGGTPCRSVVVVVTDGEDCGSRRRAGDCAKISRDLLASEQFALAMVGVGDDVDFRAVGHAMGIPDANIHVQKDATPAALRRTFQMVSQSVIRASQAKIGAGGGGFFV